jgi:hypothetical protein
MANQDEVSFCVLKDEAYDTALPAALGHLEETLSGTFIRSARNGMWLWC